MLKPLSSLLLMMSLCLSSQAFADNHAPSTPDAAQDKPAPAVSEDEAKQKTSAPLIEIFDIGQTVLKMSLQEGVAPEDAIESMRSKAVELNLKIVGHQNVSAEVSARGVETKRLEIFQFCNPEDAVKMVAFNPIYAAYMPCSIALVQDDKDKDQYWLLMLNLDMLINSIPLPDELRRIAITVNGAMLEIITAGSTGAL